MEKILLKLFFVVFVVLLWVSTVKIQPGLSTTPVCIATAKSYGDNVDMGEEFDNHSRIKATWNKKSFNLLISAVEQTDVANYVCGILTLGQFVFGNGTKLILHEYVNGEYEIPADHTFVKYNSVSTNTPVTETEEQDGECDVIITLFFKKT
uniref:Immunoglobulin V-set domain-containing protein n=1 Tax=Astyanax mexicanus TaxID=7994 RepID=A0A3B1K0S1_ASTMX